MPNPPSSPPTTTTPQSPQKRKHDKKKAKKRKRDKKHSRTEGNESKKMHQTHHGDETNATEAGNAVIDKERVGINDEREKKKEASGGSANDAINGDSDNVAVVDAAKSECEREAPSHFREGDRTIGNARCHQSSNWNPQLNVADSGSHGDGNKRKNINDGEETNARSKKLTKKKRKRKRASQENNISSISLSSSSANDKHIFRGLVFAVSTLESKNNEQPDNENNEKEPTSTSNPNTTISNAVPSPPKLNYQNYKTLTQILTQTLGAHSPISPQVHKRIHCLIATTPAIRNLTQRVRQAHKRNVDIVHVDWVRECLECGKRLDYRCGNGGVNGGEREGHLWNDRVGELIREKEELKNLEAEDRKTKKSQKNDERESLDREPKCHGNYDDLAEEVIVMEGNDDDNAGWSTPIQLDCCCVCHENGDDNCPWCLDCNINATKEKQNNETSAS
ncbi:hypothetical protein ACHAXS_007456 [Conticribra weissflogii]